MGFGGEVLRRHLRLRRHDRHRLHQPRRRARVAVPPCALLPVRAAALTRTDVVVRRITPADGSLLRDLRLRALQDAPQAFASTYADELGRPQSEWDERGGSAAGGAPRFAALAFVGAECVGLVGGFRNDDDGHHADIDLVSMWVEAAYRGSGVVEQLVFSVLEWLFSVAVGH